MSTPWLHSLCDGLLIGQMSNIESKVFPTGRFSALLRVYTSQCIPYILNVSVLVRIRCWIPVPYRKYRVREPLRRSPKPCVHRKCGTELPLGPNYRRLKNYKPVHTAATCKYTAVCHPEYFRSVIVKTGLYIYLLYIFHSNHFRQYLRQFVYISCPVCCSSQQIS